MAIWQREHGLVQTTIELVRVQGLHAGTLAQLETAWGAIGTRASTVGMVQRLRDYVIQHRPPQPDERFVASSEILESSFGKLKRIERDQSQDGMTGLVLALGAMVDTWSEDDLKQALEATPEKKVDNWVNRVLGHTMQWFRKQFFATTPSVTKTA